MPALAAAPWPGRSGQARRLLHVRRRRVDDGAGLGAEVISPWAIAVPQFVFAFGHGIHQPCGQAAVVGPFPDHAGAASALAGFILAATAVAVGAWLGMAMNGTVYPLVMTVGAMSVATALVAWTLVQRHGERA